MKFDVIVGNPPYQKGQDTRFYRKFIEKAKSLAPIHAFVIPANYFSNVKHYDKVSVYRSLGEYFEAVNINVCYYLYDITSYGTTLIDKVGKSIFRTKVQQAIGESVTDYLIYEKIRSDSGLEASTGKLYRSQAHFESTVGIKCIFTVGQKNEPLPTYTINVDQQDLLAGFGAHKVATTGMSNGDRAGLIGAFKYVAPDIGVGAAAMFIDVRNEEEANNLIAYMSSKIIRCLLKTIKGFKNNSTFSMFKQIPKIDLAKAWSDEELYQHFALSKDEIEYLERHY